MKKITFFTSCISILLVAIVCYIVLIEFHEEQIIQTNIHNNLYQLPQGYSVQSDSCLWSWYSSTTLYKVCVQQNKNISIGYGSKKWQLKLKDIPTKIQFADGDFNLNNLPELYLFGITPKGYVVQAYEYRHDKLQGFELPQLMGTNLFEYRGKDSLYFEKNFLARQFLTNSGQKVCYYELMPNLQFELRFTKML